MTKLFDLLHGGLARGQAYVRLQLLRVPITWALGTVLILSLVPTVLLGGLFLHETDKDIVLAERERTGVAYLRTIWPIYTAAHAPDIYQTTEARIVRGMQRRFAQAADRYAARSNSVDESRAAQSAMAQAAIANDTRQLREPMAELTSRVGDQSNLILDPDLDSYYLMDVVVIKLPAFVEEIRKAENARASGNTVAIAIAANQVRQLNDDIARSIEKAITANPDQSMSRRDMIAARDAMRVATGAYTGELRAALPVGPAYGALVAARNQLWITSASELDQLLAVRVEAMRRQEQINIGLAAMVTVITLALGAMLIRSLSSALQNIRYRVDAMAFGDYQSAVPGIEYDNDIGTIARALNDFVGSAEERETLARQLTEEREAAQRTLEDTVSRVEAENARLLAQAVDRQREDQARERGIVTTLATELEQQIAGMVADAHNAARNVDGSAVAMNAMAKRTQAHSRAAITSATTIGTAVGDVAPSIAEVTMQLAALRDRSDHGRDIAMQTIHRVDAVRDRIAALKTAADQIDELQEIISGIAAQTNMLALNAAIEAARDAEAGSGFRVVAAEVKSLAESSRAATAQIAEQISGIRRASNGVEQAFGQVTEAMVVLSSSATEISRGIAQQSGTVVAVENAITDAYRIVSSMTQSIAETDHAAQLTTTSSAEMAATCTQILHQITSLQGVIHDFTAGVEQAQAAEPPLRLRALPNP